MKKTKKYNPNGWYVMSDGSSAYAILGFDVEEELALGEEYEILGGEYKEEEIDDKVDYFNKQMNG